MLQLYNTLTRQEEPFEPLRDGTVRMYACGLTTYARGHIGNFRTFVCVDVLRRTLKYLCGYRVHGVVNYTDVDDKTIAGAQKAGVPLREYTDQWIAAFQDDAAALGIEVPEQLPRATDESNLRAMGEMIAALERNGHTYRRDGSIYFKINSFEPYGRLARIDHDGLHAGARVDVDEYSKDDARDFVLWKASKPGEPSWDVGAGPGRPGWHIECSAMALRLLDGPPIDIHAGGVDLIFPHHENEIAQAEAATRQPFARFWVHVEHLFVENEKMSKSLGNVYSVPDVIAKGHRASALRYLLLSSHYRKQLNFTWAGMDQAEESLRRIVDFLARLTDVRGEGSHDEVHGMVAAARTAFRAALESDLNTAAGLAAMFDLVTAGNIAIDARRMSASDAALVREAIEEFDRVLGVVSLRREEDETVPDELVREIEQQIEARNAARQRRDFATADQIRRSLADRGILLEDNPTGTRWKRK
ncbi:MAG TPA: cysteine--tRNA ligase [Vicinamibacterales bacterium]|jgi:cysteinyl-tRNA synthetase|nr:cysteine--tRNA ligase [Vicinamibacterales bacterium]